MKRSIPFTIRICAFVAALLLSAHSRAGLQIPYTPDTSSLHLWHLNETSGLTTPDAVQTNPITLTLLGLPNAGTGPYTNVTLSSPSAFPILTNAMTGLDKAHLLDGGIFPDVSQFADPTTGAFTFEAIVKFNINPLGAIDAEIVAGDNGSGLANRGWQWRIFNGVMEWNLLAGSGGDNDFKSTLPATGPNAALSNTWYHVAVTYTGEAPTNSDTAQKLTFYWTLLDQNRTNADKLGEFTMTRPLNGSPLGVSQPRLGVGGSARNVTTNPGNNEGVIGSIDEVRISNVARKPGEMAFNSSGAVNPPSFTQQPPATLLSAWGKTLTINALVSGTPPLTYRWQLNGADVPGQADSTLVISNATFANAGPYRLIVGNSAGGKTSEVSQVTIGAAATGLANTGLNPDGTVSDGNVPDPNWTLYRSADPLYLGPDAMIFENSFPLQFASPNGAFSPINGLSMWISDAPNTGGAPATSPAGNYVYRARFLLDTVDPATYSVSGNIWVNGTISDIIVNGKSTGTTIAPGGTLYVATYAITNGFVAGWNTIDFVETMGAGVSGIRVEVKGVGQALAAGKPTIVDAPKDQTVRAGSVALSKAVFSVAALGRPGLTYQWFADSTQLTGETNRTLTINNPALSSQPTNITVVVSNDSGSVTSAPAVLKIVSTNQPPVAAGFSFVAFQGQTFSLPLSQIVQTSHDPDNDPITFVGADSQSTNGVQAGVLNVVQNGATLVYTPVDNFVGADQFGYQISDSVIISSENTSSGTVNILELGQPTNQVVAVNGSATFDLGLTSAPVGYSFQWQRNGQALATQTGTKLTINNAQIADAGAYTVVVTDPLNQKWTNAPSGLTVGTLGTGTGLTADFWGDITNGVRNFPDTPTTTRIDPTIDFLWTNLQPDPSINPTYFMVRWHGQVQPLYSDTYTFSTTSDDGSRLWVDGKLIVDQWRNQAATTVSGTIALQAGQKYDIVMEYFQGTSASAARLLWNSDHQSPEVIPMTQLYPTASLEPKLSASLSGTTLTINWAGTFTLQSADSVSGPWTTAASLVVGPRTITATGAGKFYRLVNTP